MLFGVVNENEKINIITKCLRATEISLCGQDLSERIVLPNSHQYSRPVGAGPELKCRLEEGEGAASRPKRTPGLEETLPPPAWTLAYVLHSLIEHAVKVSQKFVTSVDALIPRSYCGFTLWATRRWAFICRGHFYIYVCAQVQQMQNLF